MTYTKCIFIEYFALYFRYDIAMFERVVEESEIETKKDHISEVCILADLDRCAYNINYARKKGVLISYKLKIDLTNRFACS